MPPGDSAVQRCVPGAVRPPRLGGRPLASPACPSCSSPVRGKYTEHNCRKTVIYTLLFSKFRSFVLGNSDSTFVFTGKNIYSEIKKLVEWTSDNKDSGGKALSTKQTKPPAQCLRDVQRKGPTNTPYRVTSTPGETATAQI